MRRLFLFLVGLGALLGVAFAAPGGTPGHLAASPSVRFAGTGLSGSVTDSLTSAPVANATVTASTGPTAVTGSNGSFLLGIGNGSVTLTVTAAGYHPDVVTLVFHPGGPALNVSLAPYVYAVHGAIVDYRTSVGVPAVVVVANPGDLVTTSGTSGTYRINLENGSYSLTISSPGYQTSTVHVQVDGAPVSLYLFLSPPPPPSAAPTPFSPWPIVTAGVGVGAIAATVGGWSARRRRHGPATAPIGPLAGMPSLHDSMMRARLARGRRSRSPPR